MKLNQSISTGKLSIFEKIDMQRREEELLKYAINVEYKKPTGEKLSPLPPNCDILKPNKESDNITK